MTIRLRTFQAPLHRPAKKRLLKRLSELGYDKPLTGAEETFFCGNRLHLCELDRREGRYDPPSA
jgi:hypothetical protein